MYPALPGYLFILIFCQTNAHTAIHMYNIYIRFLYIHIDICITSLVEIAPGVPELRLSGVIYRQIPHWPETQKFWHFTVMWHRSWSGRFTYLNKNGRENPLLKTLLVREQNRRLKRNWPIGLIWGTGDSPLDDSPSRHCNKHTLAYRK
jgi:hypothetical protein